MTYDFDIAVIGGGAAGLAAAGVSTHLGAKTLLIERDRLGGDCTWTGCVPSKTLLHIARTAETVRTAARYGIEVDQVRIDFQRAMQHVRETRHLIYEDADAPEVYQSMGVTVRKGAARFIDPHTLAIDGPGEHVTARYIVIATGGVPIAPSIDGLEGVEYLTTESLFELEEQPEHLIVIGAGAVGVEIAQAFRRLGTAVSIIESANRILPSEPAEAAAILKDGLEREGIGFHLNAAVRRVRRASGSVALELAGGTAISGDALLVTAGRQPNAAHLDLEKAGVRHDRGLIHSDEKGRTSVRHIYVAGDVAGRFAFTHAAEHMAKTVVTNALLHMRRSFDLAHMPSVIYTDPELARVGAGRDSLEQRGIRFEVHHFPFAKMDRAITDDAARGFIELYAKPWSGKILGATIVGAHAGELIAEVGLAMRNGISLRSLSDTIHPYPTYALGVRRAADQWYLRRRTPRIIRAVRTLFRYRGPVLEYGPEEVL